jgi:Endonuclease/Exonuclease/phosphatase family
VTRRYSSGRMRSNGQGVSTASRWPISRIVEVDLQVSSRTAGFACTSVITEIYTPPPIGRVLLVNNLPSWRLELEYERELQAVRTARAIEETLAGQPAHVIVAGDFDADPDATSIASGPVGRAWTASASAIGMHGPAHIRANQARPTCRRTG